MASAASPVPALPPPADPAALDRADPLPLWAQLHARLQRRLAAGDFTTGFPTEQRLQDEYGVSRHTVREALRHLRAAGLVVSQRGRGSHVPVGAGIEQPLGALYSLFRSVEASGREQRSVVRTLDERRDPDVAALLGLDGAEPLVHLERLRLDDGLPLALDRTWLPAAIARPLLTADFTHTALYDELARRCGTRLTGGREHISAVVPDRAERSALDLPGGVAALRILRAGVLRGRTVEHRVTVVRGDRFSLSARWSVSQDYRLDVVAAGAGPGR